MGPQNVICHSPATAQMHLAEIAIALAAKIHWMQPLDDYDARPRLLMGGGNPGITRIYDSIAAILVSQPRHEHIAATMHFHYPRHAVLLVVNNQPFDTAKTYTYLSKVWTLLRGLSREFAAIRLQAQGLSPTVDGDRNRTASFFHALHDQRVSPLIHDLKVLIYSHAVDKFHRRIDKRWEGFQALLKALKTIILNNAEVPQAEPNMNYLNLVRVSEFLEFLRERDVERGEDFFIHIVDGFNAAAAELPNVQLDEWSTLVYWHHPGDNRPFPLRKYLDKLKDLNRHIHALIGYAHSPHLRHYFTMKLFINLDIPQESQAISIPQSVSQWSIVAESILEADNLELIDPDTVLQRVVFGYTNTPDPMPASVHSEIRLLHYIESIGEASGQIYIGLSRPSCMGCHLYVKGYSVKGCCVVTRDPRDKYEFPWILPSGTEVDFKREVYRCVKEDLRERFVTFGFTKARMDE